MRIWFVGLIVGCEPDLYRECERTFDLQCECWQMCNTAEHIAEHCNEAATEDNEWNPEDWSCYNDTFEETCDQAIAHDECRL